MFNNKSVSVFSGVGDGRKVRGELPKCESNQCIQPPHFHKGLLHSTALFYFTTTVLFQ